MSCIVISFSLEKKNFVLFPKSSNLYVCNFQIDPLEIMYFPSELNKKAVGKEKNHKQFTAQ